MSIGLTIQSGPGGMIHDPDTESYATSSRASLGLLNPEPATFGSLVMNTAFAFEVVPGLSTTISFVPPPGTVYVSANALPVTSSTIATGIKIRFSSGRSYGDATTAKNDLAILQPDATR